MRYPPKWGPDELSILTPQPTRRRPQRKGRRPTTPADSWPPLLTCVCGTGSEPERIEARAACSHRVVRFAEHGTSAPDLHRAATQQLTALGSGVCGRSSRWLPVDEKAERPCRRLLKASADSGFRPPVVSHADQPEPLFFSDLQSPLLLESSTATRIASNKELLSSTMRARLAQR